MKHRGFGMLTAAVIAVLSCQPVSAAETDRRSVEGQDGFIFTDEYSKSAETNFVLGKNGTFTCEFKPAEQYWAFYGKKPEERVTFAELAGAQPSKTASIGCGARIRTEGEAFYGSCCWLAQPKVQILMLDGWQTDDLSKYISPQAKIGSAPIGAVTYDYYKITVQEPEAPYARYYCVPPENGWFSEPTEEREYAYYVQPLNDHLRNLSSLSAFAESMEQAYIADVSEFVWGGKGAECSFETFDASFRTAALNQSDPGAEQDPLRAHQNIDYTYEQGGSTLKDRFGPYFRVGTSLNSFAVQRPDFQQFVKKQFNSITCENEMTPEQIIKKIDGTEVTVDLSGADNVLKYAEENGIGVRGRSFIWYSQTPNGMFRGTPEESDQRIENFIKETFSQLKTNYPDLKLYAYDVVNEPFKNEGGGLRIRNGTGSDLSQWTNIYGEDNDSFIIHAFKSARKYAPADCKLFLNEYNEYMPEKRDDIYDLAKRIMAEGDYIDGIGMESHLDASYPDKQLYEDAIKKFTSLGLDIQITELDLTDSKRAGEEAQLLLWRNVSKVLMNHANGITSVTMWNPVAGWITDVKYATLFDKMMQPNDAYQDFMYPGWVSPIPVTTTNVPTEGLRGDANCDDHVDISDAVLILRCVVEDREAVITDQGKTNADADRDGKVSSDDAKLILQYIAKKITF